MEDILLRVLKNMITSPLELLFREESCEIEMGSIVLATLIVLLLNKSLIEELPSLTGEVTIVFLFIYSKFYPSRRSHQIY